MDAYQQNTAHEADANEEEEKKKNYPTKKYEHLHKKLMKAYTFTRVLTPRPFQLALCTVWRGESEIAAQNQLFTQSRSTAKKENKKIQY